MKMGQLTSYTLELRTLPIGSQQFNYVVGNDFFALREETEIRSGEVDVTLEVIRKGDIFNLFFTFKGEIVVACDRCLDDMTLPIDSDYQVVIKYSDNPSDDNDEVIEVAENVRDYDLTDLIYDSIALEIPMKHRHADDLKKIMDANPDCIVVSYANTTAEVKALTDVVVTSSNAKEIVESFPKEQKIIFGPDRNLGNYINSLTGRNMKLWDGSCLVHEKFSLDKLVGLKKQYPEAKVLAHPECKKALLVLADKVGSTKGLLDYAIKSEAKQFIVVTESGILYEMKKACPDKEFIPAPPDDSTCACNQCHYMRLNTLEKIYNCLKYEQPEIVVDEALCEKAVRPINKMLEISRKLGLIK